MYTGNTPQLTKCRLGWPVYPCVYREHVEDIRLRFALRGLSLCIQGTPAVAFQKSTRHRFIPVYTGNTAVIFLILANSSVYPCVYREHNYFHIMHLLKPGLSLCIQGTQEVYSLYAPEARFIPVYTGNTNSCNPSSYDNAVYPCVYREHYYSLRQTSNKGGLSLCIQGTLIANICKSIHTRFIPVYTGNT